MIFLSDDHSSYPNSNLLLCLLSRCSDGRWAFTKSEVYTDIDSNAFGYLRGPWNMNPSPYISRFATNSAPQLPTCAKV